TSADAPAKVHTSNVDAAVGASKPLTALANNVGCRWGVVVVARKHNELQRNHHRRGNNDKTQQNEQHKGPHWQAAHFALLSLLFNWLRVRIHQFLWHHWPAGRCTLVLYPATFSFVQCWSGKRCQNVGYGIALVGAVRYFEYQ